MDNSLVTIEESFLVILDSHNADSYDNGTKNSLCTFYFEEPIRKRLESLQMSCSVLQFTAPNSIYNINETNNKFNFSETINGTPQPYNILIPYGNYNANTFMTQFILSITPYTANFKITMNPLTFVYTITNQAGNYFVIHASSTIGEVMGFIEGAELGSLVNQFICEYPCNFNGINSVNIALENINTNNIDSLNKSNSSIIQSVGIDPSYPVINFMKSQSYNFSLSVSLLDHLTVGLRDNLNNYLNFHNKHWTLTLVFNILKDIDRFSHESTFHNIINYT